MSLSKPTISSSISDEAYSLLLESFPLHKVDHDHFPYATGAILPFPSRFHRSDDPLQVYLVDLQKNQFPTVTMDRLYLGNSYSILAWGPVPFTAYCVRISTLPREDSPFGVRFWRAHGRGTAYKAYSLAMRKTPQRAKDVHYKCPYCSQQKPSFSRMCQHIQNFHDKFASQHVCKCGLVSRNFTTMNAHHEKHKEPCKIFKAARKIRSERLEVSLSYVESIPFTGNSAYSFLQMMCVTGKARVVKRKALSGESLSRNEKKIVASLRHNFYHLDGTTEFQNMPLLIDTIAYFKDVLGELPLAEITQRVSQISMMFSACTSWVGFASVLVNVGARVFQLTDLNLKDWSCVVSSLFSRAGINTGLTLFENDFDFGGALSRIIEVCSEGIGLIGIGSYVQYSVSKLHSMAGTIRDFSTLSEFLMKLGRTIIELFQTYILGVEPERQLRARLCEEILSSYETLSSVAVPKRDIHWAREVVIGIEKMATHQECTVRIHKKASIAERGKSMVMLAPFRWFRANHQKALALLHLCRKRPEPVGIFFKGRPGTGKSGLMEFFSSILISNKFNILDPQEITSRIYPRPQGDRMDGVSENHAVITMDDWFAQDDSLVRGAQAAEIIQLVSPVTYTPEMAELEYKGVIHPCPTWVFLTSNLSVHDGSKLGITSISALTRRFAIIEVKHRPSPGMSETDLIARIRRLAPFKSYDDVDKCVTLTITSWFGGAKTWTVTSRELAEILLHRAEVNEASASDTLDFSTLRVQARENPSLNSQTIPGIQEFAQMSPVGKWYSDRGVVLTPFGYKMVEKNLVVETDSMLSCTNLYLEMNTPVFLNPPSVGDNFIGFIYDGSKLSAPSSEAKPSRNFAHEKYIMPSWFNDSFDSSSSSEEEDSESEVIVVAEAKTKKPSPHINPPNPFDQQWDDDFEDDFATSEEEHIPVYGVDTPTLTPEFVMPPLEESKRIFEELKAKTQKKEDVEPPFEFEVRPFTIRKPSFDKWFNKYSMQFDKVSLVNQWCNWFLFCTGSLFMTVFTLLLFTPTTSGLIMATISVSYSLLWLPFRKVALYFMNIWIRKTVSLGTGRLKIIIRDASITVALVACTFGTYKAIRFLATAKGEGTYSSDHQTKKTPTRASAKVKVTATSRLEGGDPMVYQEIRSLFHSNQCILATEEGESINVLGIGRGLYLTTAHEWKSVQDSPKLWLMRQNFRIEAAGSRKVHLFVHETFRSEIVAVDLGINTKEIWRKFRSSSSWSNTYYCATISLMVHHKSQFTNQLIEVDDAKLHEKVIFIDDKSQPAWAYVIGTGTTYPGVCSSPWLFHDKLEGQKLGGLHIASHQGHPLCGVVYREWLEELMTQYQSFEHDLDDKVSRYEGVGFHFSNTIPFGRLKYKFKGNPKPPKTKYRRSLVVGKPTQIPALESITTNVGVSRALALHELKFARSPKCPADFSVFCVQHRGVFLPLFTQVNRLPSGIGVALNGNPNNFQSSANRKAGSGFPWTWLFPGPGKSGVLEGTPPNVSIKPSALTKFSGYITSHYSGFSQNVSIMSWKDELLPLEKVLLGKVRLYMPGTLHMYILADEIFGSLFAIMSHNPEFLWFGPGIDMLGFESHLLYRYLQSNDCDPSRVIMMDISGMDVSEAFASLNGILQMLISAGKEAGMPDDWCSKARLYGAASLQQLWAILGIVFCVYGRMQSGQRFTAEMNTLLLRYIFMYLFCKGAMKFESLSPLEAMNCWNNNIRSTYYGDDSVLTIRKKKHLWFTPSWITDQAKELFGMIFTSIRKDGTMVYEQFSEVSFLKRTFKLVDHYWHAVRSLDDILEGVYYWREDGLSARDAMLAKTESMMLDLALHGKDVYNREKTRLNRRLLKAGYLPVDHPYVHFEKRYLSTLK